MLLYYLLVVWMLSQYSIMTPLFMLGTMGVLFVYWFKNQTRRFLQKDIIILCFLILWILFNTFTIGDTSRGLNKLIPFISGFFIPYFLLVAHYKNLDKVKGMFAVWMIIAVLSGILSIGQAIFGDAFYFLQYRLFPDVDVVRKDLIETGHYVGLGIFRSRSVNASFMLIALLFLYDKLRTIKVNSRIGIVVLLSMVVLIFGIISSNSRSHIALLFVDFTIIFLIQYFIIHKHWKDLLTVGFIGFVLLSTYIFSEWAQGIVGGLLGRFDSLESDYYQGRRMYWEASINQLRTLSDYIGGIGFGVTGNTSTSYEVHNGYIELLVELGIIGCLIWGLFCIIHMYRIINTLNNFKFHQDYLSEYTIIMIIFINGLLGRLGGGGFIDSDIFLAIGAGMITVHYTWIFQQQSLPITEVQETHLPQDIA